MTEVLEKELSKGAIQVNFDDSKYRYTRLLTTNPNIASAPLSTEEVWDIATNQVIPKDFNNVYGFVYFNSETNSKLVENYLSSFEQLRIMYPNMQPERILKQFFNPDVSISSIPTLSFFDITIEELHTNDPTTIERVKGIVRVALKKRAEEEKQTLINDAKQHANEDSYKDIMSSLTVVFDWLDKLATDNSLFDSCNTVSDLLRCWPVALTPAPWKCSNSL